MLNVLLNELKCFDRDFLCYRTNAPYLVGGDGNYLKAENSGKPLVWDQTIGAPLPFDKEGIRPALEGSFTVNGIACRPAFDGFERASQKL